MRCTVMEKIMTTNKILVVYKYYISIMVATPIQGHQQLTYDMKTDGLMNIHIKSRSYPTRGEERF